MTNLEQVRAKHALDAMERISQSDKKGRGKRGGDALSSFPALILNNGLLATVAYCKKQGEGYEAISGEIARHLGYGGSDELLRHLANSESAELRLKTAEALAYLNYLRRFAKAMD